MLSIIWTVNLLLALALPGRASTPHKPAPSSPERVSPTQAMSAGYEDPQWQVTVPELGADSPQASILRVDPRTHATQLLIRMPQRMHIPMHWHRANETHTG